MIPILALHFIVDKRFDLLLFLLGVIESKLKVFQLQLVLKVLVVLYLILLMLWQLTEWALLSRSCLEKAQDFGMQLTQLPGLLVLLIPESLYCLLLRCLRLLKLRNLSLKSCLLRGRVVMVVVVG